jgi:predicted enzyme involved in methoxymalonyl-ACP biosynthesis
MMYAIAHYAREAGATTLRAAYVPTLKNSLVRNLFTDHSMRALPHSHQAYGQAEWTGTGEITIFEAQLDDLPDAPPHVKLTLV